jgi:hypothetical protein
MVSTLKEAVGKAKGPAIAVGAAAAGVAGGLALKSRRDRKTLLGVHIARSLAKDLDVKSVAKSVGKASRKVGQTSKSVSRDIERVGQQAERIGKILS